MKFSLSWSTGIALVYGVFVSFFLGLVIYFSFFHKQVDLVAENYYAQEIAYQDQMDRIERTQALPDLLKINHVYDQRVLTIAFPANMEYTRIAGRIHFFRPSDAGQDRIVPLFLSNAGKQHISTRNLARGYWIIKIYWMTDNTEYYTEESLVLN